MKNVILIACAVLVALIGGWDLEGSIARLPGEMPDFLDNFIRWMLTVVGAAQLNNSYDIEVIAFLLAVLACAVLVGGVEAASWLLTRRLRLIRP